MARETSRYHIKFLSIELRQFRGVTEGSESPSGSSGQAHLAITAHSQYKIEQLPPNRSAKVLSKLKAAAISRCSSSRRGLHVKDITLKPVVWEGLRQPKHKFRDRQAGIYHPPPRRRFHPSLGRILLPSSPSIIRNLSHRPSLPALITRIVLSSAQPMTPFGGLLPEMPRTGGSEGL